MSPSSCKNASFCVGFIAPPPKISSYELFCPWKFEVVIGYKYYCVASTTMTYEVKVTRKGQTTIPAELRTKHGIEEGSRLIVVETKEGILFKRAITTADLAGSGSSRSSPKEMKELLDKLRGEDF